MKATTNTSVHPTMDELMDFRDDELDEIRDHTSRCRDRFLDLIQPPEEKEQSGW